MITLLNAARKRRAGLADTGRCTRCGRYRMFCNGPLGCIDDPKPDPWVEARQALAIEEGRW